MPGFNLAIDAFGILLSVRSIMILGARSPWICAGWAAVAVYFAVLFIKNATRLGIGTAGEYAIVAIIAVTWIVGVVQDEAQAEPWWWPRTRGLTRAERRTRDDNR